MKKHIDKAAVVAEIERLQDAIKATAIDNRISKEQAEAYKVCVKLRSFVEDTLEVKEVKEPTASDAFIEKACKWLREGGNGWYLHSEFGEDDINFVKLAEDFKTYIKGE